MIIWNKIIFLIWELKSSILMKMTCRITKFIFSWLLTCAIINSDTTQSNYFKSIGDLINAKTILATHWKTPNDRASPLEPIENELHNFKLYFRAGWRQLVVESSKWNPSYRVDYLMTTISPEVDRNEFRIGSSEWLDGYFVNLMIIDL